MERSPTAYRTTRGRMDSGLVTSRCVQRECELHTASVLEGDGELLTACWLLHAAGCMIYRSCKSLHLSTSPPLHLSTSLRATPPPQNWSITLLGTAGLVAFANTLRRFLRERRSKRLHGRFLAAGAGGGPVGTTATSASTAHHDKRHNGSSGSMPAQAAAAAAAAASGGEQRHQGRQQGGSRIGPEAAEPAGAGDDVEGGLTGQTAAPPTGVHPHSQPTQQQGQRLGAWNTHPLTRPRERWDWLSVSHCLVMQTATSAAFCVTLWCADRVLLVGASIGLERRPADRVTGAAFAALWVHSSCNTSALADLFAPAHAPHSRTAATANRYWVSVVGVAQQDLSQEDASSYIAHAGELCWVGLNVVVMSGGECVCVCLCVCV